MNQAFDMKLNRRSWGPIRLILFSVTLLLLAAVIFFVYDLTFEPRYMNRDTNTNQVNTSVEITKDTAVSQSFRYDKALLGISVLMKNTDKLAAGHISIQVRDFTTGSVLYNATLEAEDIADGEFRFLGFGDKVTSPAGYEVLVTSEDAVTGTAVSMWVSQTVSDEIDKVVINRRPIHRVLRLRPVKTILRITPRDFLSTDSFLSCCFSPSSFCIFSSTYPACTTGFSANDFGSPPELSFSL